MDHRERIKKAIHKYVNKNTPKETKRKRKNNSPELSVQKDVIAWGRAHGWSLDVVEAKATFSEKQGRYISNAVAAGFSDITGCDDTGHSVFIELKAPGKLKTLRVSQYDFLLEKINRNSFACVVDSADLLEKIHLTWKSCENKRKFLLDLLEELKPSILKNQDEDELF